MSDHNSPPPDDRTPSRRRRSNSPPSPTLPQPTSFTPPPRRPPPMMGVPGRSAFRRYTRPMRAHHLSWPISRPLFRPYRPPPPTPAAAAGALVPTMGRGSLHPLPPPPPLPSRMAFKRPREGEEGSGSGGGDGSSGVRCSVCGKTFRTDKALFGHMRSHPERGWKGAHPPPAFSAEEEYADLRRMAAVAGQNLAGRGVREDQQEGGQIILPDLNSSPPRDSGDDEVDVEHPSPTRSS